MGLGVSREWCIAHEETFQSGPETLCEGVQFVSGLALLAPKAANQSGADAGTEERDSGYLVMTYGVMDCDARVVRLPLRTALSAIRFDAARGQRKDRRRASVGEL